MLRRTHLVIIDPQNSFCRVVEPQWQQVVHDGELCIPGAWDDMLRLSAVVRRLGGRIEAVHVTLDSHHLLHIAHPTWFRDAAMAHPGPFTIMRAERGRIVGSRADASGAMHDVGEFTTTRGDLFDWTLAYLEQLAAGGRYPHCIWPPHCLIGTPGHNIVAPLMEALLEWSRLTLRHVNLALKGSNPRVEHFSAVRAEVPDPGDPATQLNAALIEALMAADEILLAGEAGSHCLANTVRDIAREAGDAFVKKCVLLTDGTSPVPGFERYQEDFAAQMTGRGMRLASCGGLA